MDITGLLGVATGGRFWDIRLNQIVPVDEPGASHAFSDGCGERHERARRQPQRPVVQRRPRRVGVGGRYGGVLESTRFAEHSRHAARMRQRLAPSERTPDARSNAVGGADTGTVVCTLKRLLCWAMAI